MYNFYKFCKQQCFSSNLFCLAIKCYLAINRLFIDEKLSGHKIKSNLAIKKLTRPDQTRPDQTRLQSRGPNSRTCVLVLCGSISLLCLLWPSRRGVLSSQTGLEWEAVLRGVDSELVILRPSQLSIHWS